MGVHIQPRRPTIALDIRVPGAVAKLVGRNHAIGALIEPVLGADMAVVGDDGGQARDRVIGVRYAVLGAGLVRDELDKDRVAHAGRAVCVQVGRVPGLADVGDR